MDIQDRLTVLLSTHVPPEAGMETGQSLYRRAKREGWLIAMERRMMGVRLIVTHGSREASCFADTEEAVWEGLAELWNDAEGDFWHITEDS